MDFEATKKLAKLAYRLSIDRYENEVWASHFSH